ncbi:MAG: hypothetical protein ACLURV_02845 [Gallintestinimicrobium sp.]
MIFHAPWRRLCVIVADRDDIVASRGEHGSHLERRIRMNGIPNILTMIEEGYLEPGDEKISKSYAMGALTYGEAP